MKHSASLSFIFGCALCAVFSVSAFGQTTDTTHGKKVLRQDIGIVKKLTVMPYVTGSFNLQSGDAFSKSAEGLGYGFGLALDFTEDKQALGLYIDFAYQDMRASAANGACGHTYTSGDLLESLNVTHYFSYASLEGFLKLQSEKTNGYFLLGASVGLATTQLTVRDGAIPADQFSDWNGATNPATNQTYSNKFRLDLRAGIGIKLARVSGHELVFEARLGYPVTTAITGYTDVCNGTPSANGGTWRVVTLQGNLGLRL